jgi:hypothetical protein
MFNVNVIREKNTEHRLTVSPHEKRITIKLAKGTNAIEADRVMKFYLDVSTNYTIESGVSMRGKMKIGDYRLQMKNKCGTIAYMHRIIK